MKKILCALIAAAAVCTAAFAQDAQKDESKWADISYANVPIYKILETKDAYVVIYAKNRTGTGSTTIPKKWANGDTENPRKLKMRIVSGKLGPFMTIVKKDNSFLRVILSVPASKANSVWGMADPNKVTDTDKDTLEELEL
jgi:hypothetical protein